MFVFFTGNEIGKGNNAKNIELKRNSVVKVHNHEITWNFVSHLNDNLIGARSRYSTILNYIFDFGQ